MDSDDLGLDERNMVLSLDVPAHHAAKSAGNGIVERLVVFILVGVEEVLDCLEFFSIDASTSLDLVEDRIPLSLGWSFMKFLQDLFHKARNASESFQKLLDLFILITRPSSSHGLWRVGIWGVGFSRFENSVRFCRLRRGHRSLVGTTK